MSLTAEEHHGGRGATHLLSVVKGPGVQMKRTTGEEREGKGRIGQRSLPVTPPLTSNLYTVTGEGTTTVFLIEVPVAAPA